MPKIRRLVHQTALAVNNNHTELSCYYCGKDFHRDSVTEVLEYPRAQAVAYICPHCGIDAVVPRTIRNQYTDKEWKEAHDYWFGIATN